MAGPKKSLPAPIDRPLSRAYLRKFTGWSTAYPPGVSDPGSLQVMENLLINREGSVRVRPGLQHLTKLAGGAPWGLAGETLVGSLENFYLNDGRKAYLFAVRAGHAGGSGLVEFRVGVEDTVTGAIEPQAITTHFDCSAWPANRPGFSSACTYVRYVQIDNRILALSDSGEPSIVFYVGATKKVPRFSEIPDPAWDGGSRGGIDMPSRGWIMGPQTTQPDHAVDFSSTESIAQAWGDSHNVYNYAFCYTYSNELGETAPSEIAQFKAQRPWGGWSWNTPRTDIGLDTQTSSPSQTPTTTPRDASDQLSLIIPATASARWDSAIAAGATKVNFYVMSWSDQAPVPVEMQLVGSRDISPSTPHYSHGWFMLTPATLGLGPTIPVPTQTNRDKLNTTKPPAAAQGLVAADRLVLVNDKTAGAVIRWSTNEMGNYLNFSVYRGGGYKTLTSGNMQVPAVAKLWQNPQSADTITVLCMGTDGHSTSYYMAPASVTSQSDNTQVMGFEETTATPGTVSPFGCEVANNALYHPLDDQLMKSTASNYNITHKSMTDDIADRWQALKDKHRIVSCFFDQRLYFLVHNPDGEPLPAGCNGNEIWVLDLSSEGGSWSRWLVPGVSLRKIEVLGRLVLGLVRPEGIYSFDPSKHTDALRSGDVVTETPIGWKLQTNTQGANRAHDAWAHLRQVSITVGDFTGAMRYGVKGQDLNGRWQEKAKVYRQTEHLLGPDTPHFDAEDHLAVARDLKEWFFFAESLPGEESFGQISLAQYRYTPISVNVGYDYGQVETFEYARAAAGQPSYTDNGVPQPYLDTTRT